jgi:hypothetical protein
MTSSPFCRTFDTLSVGKPLRQTARSCRVLVVRFALRRLPACPSDPGERPTDGTADGEGYRLRTRLPRARLHVLHGSIPYPPMALVCQAAPQRGALQGAGDGRMNKSVRWRAARCAAVGV